MLEVLIDLSLLVVCSSCIVMAFVNLFQLNRKVVKFLRLLHADGGERISSCWVIYRCLFWRKDRLNSELVGARVEIVSALIKFTVYLVVGVLSGYWFEIQ